MTQARPRAAKLWVELPLWAAALVLLSPLVAYASAGVMPLWALWAIAAGIAVALGLVGVRLHGALLADALARREGPARFLLVAALSILAIFLVLFGAAVALLLILRSGSPTLPV